MYNHPEWLLIDKIGDFFYYDKIEDIIEDTGLTKSQIDNVYKQSLKHYNKYTNRGLYIQRLYNDPTRTPKNNYVLNKYIYYENIKGEKEWGVKFKKS